MTSLFGVRVVPALCLIAVGVMFAAGTASAAAPTTPYPIAVLADTPAAYWRLGEASGTTAADSGVNAISAVYKNFPQRGVVGALAGDTNTAIRLSGSDYVEAPLSATLNPAAFSVEAWANVTGGAGRQRAIAVSRSTDNFSGYALYVDGNGFWGFAVGAGTTAWWNGVTGPAAVLNQWTHVAGTYDGTTLRLYINGSLFGSTPVSFRANTTRATRIGMGASDTGTSWAFAGSLDEVAIYPRALSASRVTAHYSAALGAPSAPANSALPTVSGSAAVGSVLSSGTGTWNGAPTAYAYQWSRCDASGAACSAIPGAVASTYLVTVAEYGATLRAAVTATNALGSATATSLATAVVPAPPSNTVLPAITGTTKVTSTLTVSKGTWTGAPTGYTYQWKRCDTAGLTCAAISGATSTTYKLVATDGGATVRADVRATNSAGATTATSAATTAIQVGPLNTVLPAVTGTATVNSTLTVSNGTWTPTPSAYAYQWKRCDTAGAGCAAISGATSTTYKLVAADGGATVRADVRATDASGTATATSAPTATVPVPPVAPANTAVPTITGAATAGNTLTATTGTWSGTPATYAFQWKRCDAAGAACAAIAGAIASTLALTAANAGSTYVITVTATNAVGSASATSAATAVVPATPVGTYAAAVAADAPVAYWRLDETSGTVAAATTGAAGAYKGAPTLGQAGALAEGDKAPGLNGTSQYVEAPYSAALNPTPAFTVEAWVKVTGGQGTLRSIVTSRDFTSLSTGYSIYASAGNTWQFIVGVGGSNQWVYTDGGSVTLNQWTHIVGTYEQWPGEYRLYVNGKAVAVTTSNYLAQPNTKWPLRIGAGKTESTSPTYYTPGSIDEVAVYNRALTPVRVAQHYNAGIGVATAATATPVNPIQAENQLAGTSAWKRQPTAAVEGYSSQVSVLPGAAIDLHVSARGVSYRIDLYRLGWYSGLGGRLIGCSPSCASDRAGTQYAVPSPDPVTGLIAAGWPVTDTLTIPADAPSGIYTAQLVVTSGADTGKASQIPIVVREPISRRAAALVEVPVNTWQAYNGWGGKSLYAINSTGGVPAVKVSFDRPYLTTGTPMWAWDVYTDAPSVFDWEIQLYRFLEREGVDVSYQTNSDTVQAPASFLGRKTLIDAGHDEYWSKEELDAWYAARDSGVNLLFFGGSLAYWQSRYEDNSRTLVMYRTPGSDPIADQTKATYRFSVLGRPECQLIGTGNQEGVATDHRNYTVASAALADPWLAGTGFQAGDTIADGVGYEWQGIIAGCIPQPITNFFHYDSTVNNGVTFGPADVTRYTAASGARVFSASSLQFTWALDDFLTDRAADARVQQFVRNALADVLR